MNKPFDRILKAFVDEAPEMFLRFLGIVPRRAKITIARLRPETAPPVILPDYVASLEIGAAKPKILHVEFLVAYHGGIPSVMARYGGSLAWQYRCDVMSILILLRPLGVPASIPVEGEFSIGRTLTRHPFRTIRLWEVDPAPILDSKDWRLLPCALLMKSSDEDVRRVAKILAQQGDQELVGRFLTLGSLRYDRNQLESMLGGPKMGLLEAILEGSSIIREEREKGVLEGREEGREEGRLVEARRLLRVALKAKFPGLEAASGIDAVSKPEVIESLLESVIGAADRSAIERVLAAAVPHD